MPVRSGIGPRVPASGVALLLMAAGALSCAQPEPPQNLIFISLDTTRRDHMSLYGYERPTTPFLKTLGDEGAVFTHAFSQFNSTVASHTSMFTSLYPHTHGNRRRAGLDPEFLTMAEILGTAGFRTAAFVSGFTLKAYASSLDRGFEIYDDDFGSMRRDGGRTTDQAIDWVRSLRPDERYFLFLHSYDAHGKYREGEHIEEFRSAEPGPRLGVVPQYQRIRDAEREVIRDLSVYVDRYDSQIRYEDDLVRRLLESLPTENTLVVVTSDHGETLGERHAGHNLNHGSNLFQEQISIPLLIHGPGVAARRLDVLAETVDLLPTVTDLLDVPLPDDLRVGGQNWARCLRGDDCPRGRGVVFSQGSIRPAAFGREGARFDGNQWMECLQTERWKLIWYPGREEDHRELYDLVNDPMETTDVGEREPEILARMERLRLEWRARGDKADAQPLDRPEDLDKLKALGYVE